MHRCASENRDIREFAFLSDYGDADVVESGCDQKLLDRIDLVAGERHVVKLWRIGGKEAPRHLVRDAAERIVSMRIPDAEHIAAAWGENTIGLGKGFGLVRKEHHAELTDDGVEACIGKGKRDRVGRLEADLLAGPKLGARDIEHRRVEIGRRELRVCWQCVTQLPRDDTGAGGGFEHPRRTAGSDTPGDISGIPGEDDRAEALIVVLRDIADKTGCIAAHR